MTSTDENSSERAGDSPAAGTLQTEWPDKPSGPPPEKASALAFFKELPVLVVIAFGLALLIKTFLIQAFYIPSESMLPTLEVRDRVLVNKLVYRFREPRRGEIIVFVAERDMTPKSLWQRIRGFLTEGLGVAQPAERDFIKRVIGLPGETLEYTDGVVSITRPNGDVYRLTEPYAKSDTRHFGPTTVEKDEYFVMGDNRTNSSDSRFSLGTIARKDIVGKAFVRIWPPKRVAVFGKPGYTAKKVTALGAVATSPLGLGFLIAGGGSFARRRLRARRRASSS